MSSPVTRARPVDRYGPAPRPSRRLALGLGIVVVLVGIGVAYLGYQRFGPTELESERISYDVVDNSTVSLRFTVTRQDPSREAVCIVRARSKDGSETGRREIYIEPSSNGTTVVDTQIRTSRTPGAADVYGCSFDVPSYLHTP